MLRIGDTAPDFEASDQNRQMHRLSDHRGEWVLLYFYPKDFTSGCTAEACGFRDAFPEYKGKAVILGVSPDTVDSHREFAERYKLPFPLLADPDRHIHALYGVGTTLGKRVSFLVDPDGEIDEIYDEVKPEIHARQVLEDLSVAA
jgi:peroxiredoxin Q/BCP